MSQSHKIATAMMMRAVAVATMRAAAAAAMMEAPLCTSHPG
jgi:hypothetical protein